MLTRANRLVSGEDFRLVARRGRRMKTENLLVTSLVTDCSRPARFGFVMTKKLGNAVHRNRLRRQLRAISWEFVRDGLTGIDVIVRGMPGSMDADWDSLHQELASAVQREGGLGQ